MSDRIPTSELAQRWRTRVEQELSGKSPDPKVAFERLTTRLADGSAIAPIYVEAPSARAESRAAEPTLSPWPVTPGDHDLDLREAEQCGAAPAEVLALALRALHERPDTPVVHLGLSPDILQQVATLRALRRLAARLSELDQRPRPFLVHAHTSVRQFTRHDPWVNQLRNSAAVFAAVVGQADRITPVPWDAPLGQPSEDARRLAEHTVRIALHESQLGVADDPSAGAYAIETLTETLCAEAWALAADPVALEAKIAKTQAERERRVARRADVGGAFVGATLYPDLDEPAVAREPGPDLGPRLAAPFELLRDAGQAQGARVFLATWGPLARHMARTTWVGHLCAAGGIRAVDPSPAEGYASVEDAAEAFAASGTRLAILSAADVDWGPGGAALTTLASALKARGATVLVAGRPSPDLDPSAFTGFIHAAQPALDVLQDLHTRLFGGAP